MFLKLLISRIMGASGLMAFKKSFAIILTSFLTLLIALIRENLRFYWFYPARKNIMLYLKALRNPDFLLRNPQRRKL